MICALIQLATPGKNTCWKAAAAIYGPRYIRRSLFGKGNRYAPSAPAARFNPSAQVKAPKPPKPPNPPREPKAPRVPKPKPPRPITMPRNYRPPAELAWDNMRPYGAMDDAGRAAHAAYDAAQQPLPPLVDDIDVGVVGDGLPVPKITPRPAPTKQSPLPPPAPTPAPMPLPSTMQKAGDTDTLAHVLDPIVHPPAPIPSDLIDQILGASAPSKRPDAPH